MTSLERHQQDQKVENKFRKQYFKKNVLKVLCKKPQIFKLKLKIPSILWHQLFQNHQHQRDQTLLVFPAFVLL